MECGTIKDLGVIYIIAVRGVEGVFGRAFPLLCGVARWTDQVYIQPRSLADCFHLRGV